VDILSNNVTKRKSYFTIAGLVINIPKKDSEKRACILGEKNAQSLFHTH